MSSSWSCGDCDGSRPTRQWALALDGHDHCESTEVHRTREKGTGLRLRRPYPRASSQPLLQVVPENIPPTGETQTGQIQGVGHANSGRARVPGSRPQSSLLPLPPPFRGLQEGASQQSPCTVCVPQGRNGRVGQPRPTHSAARAGSQRLPRRPPPRPGWSAWSSGGQGPPEDRV